MREWVRVYKLSAECFATESARPYRATRAPRQNNEQTTYLNPSTKFVADRNAFI
jgi:hypothetical protein